MPPSTRDEVGQHHQKVAFTPRQDVLSHPVICSVPTRDSGESMAAEEDDFAQLAAIAASSTHDAEPAAPPSDAFSNSLSNLAAFVGVLIACFGVIVWFAGDSLWLAVGCVGIGSLLSLVSLHNEIRIAWAWNAERLAMLAEAQKHQRQSAPQNSQVATAGTPPSRRRGPAIWMRALVGLIIVSPLCALAAFAMTLPLEARLVVAFFCFGSAIYFGWLLLYFHMILWFEDNFAVYLFLLVLAGVGCAPTFVSLFFAPAFVTSLLAFIVHVVVLGSAIKMCVNGTSPTFCAFFYFVNEIAVAFAAGFLGALEIAAIRGVVEQ